MSRAMLPKAQTEIVMRQIEALPEFEELSALSKSDVDQDAELYRAVIDEAARYSHEQLGPLNLEGDDLGCRISEGRVRTVPRHREAWIAFREGGWPSINLPEASGGQGLPLLLTIAVQELFDRHCPAFGMLMVPTRSAALLIGAFGDDLVKDEWLPKLTAAEWGATICISEEGAGSDVPRLRTAARLTADGWSVTGEKNWISFGDHDLTTRIGHCVLARTPGHRGLSLFLVPDNIDGVRNGVAVRRLEHKMGLHTSPTCAMGFENARGWLLGTEGRGLAQMFVMITNMRIAVGAQGLGIAAGALDVALGFAEDRKQGGHLDAPPVAIAEHPDIQRQLLSMAARVDSLRGLLLTLSALADLSRLRSDDGDRDMAAQLVGWLLPIGKTLGGEIAISVASDAIQVLGGSGYTRDWPVEQSLRDARVLTVFEGTTGIQALDLLHRRLWRDGGTGLRAFCDQVRREASVDAEPDPVDRTVVLLEQAADLLMVLRDDSRAAEGVATPFLDLAGLAAMGWIARRNVRTRGDDPASRRLRASGAFFLESLEARANTIHSTISSAKDLSSAFEAIRTGV